MPYTDLGTIEDMEGNKIEVRWDDASSLVQLRVFRFPTKGAPYWHWESVGLATSVDAALKTAKNWLGDSSL